MNIDRLPVPALYELFSFFNVGERKALLGTFPEWDPVLQTINKHTTSLWVYPDHSNYPYQKRWSFGNQLVSYHNSIETSSFHSLVQENSGLLCLENLRRLHLADSTGRMPANFKLAFPSLEHLELEDICLNDRLLSDLPNLKVLVVRNCWTHRNRWFADDNGPFADAVLRRRRLLGNNQPLADPTLRINTPSLEVLLWYPKSSVFDNFPNEAPERRVSFVTPVQLRYLECESYPLPIDNMHLDRLETLLCKRMHKELQQIALDLMPALKQLQVCEPIANKRLARNLELQRLDRHDLSLAFLNLYNFTFTDPLSCYPTPCYWIRAEHLRSRLSELSTASIPYRLCCYYNGFSEQFDGHQMRALLKRFTDVYAVDVFDKVDPGDLLEFLRHCGPFKVLDLYYTSLDQSFYDQLGKFSSLVHLKIKEQTSWRIRSYEFLRDLPELRTIFIYWDGVSFEIEHIIAFLEAAFRYRPNLKQFAFGRKYFNCVISQSRSGFCVNVRPQQKIDLPRYFYTDDGLDQLIADLRAKQHELSKKIRIPIRVNRALY